MQLTNYEQKEDWTNMENKNKSKKASLLEHA